MAKPREPPIPKERAETMRQAIVAELHGGALSARDIAARLGLRERDVVPHLEHLEQSLRAKGERLVIVPATCLGCTYVFRDRRSLTKPGRCPSCRGERIEAPRFRVEGQPQS